MTGRVTVAEVPGDHAETVMSRPGDGRFYERRGPFRLADIVALCQGTACHCDLVLTGIAPLQIAGPNELSFFNSARYAPALAASRAGAIIVPPGLASRVPQTAVAIVTEAAYEAWARAAALFHPPAPHVPGIHPTAHVSPSALVDRSASVGAFAFVNDEAVIGPDCEIGSHASVGRGVTVGPSSRVGAHVSVSHAVLGARVHLHPGVRIGQEGFSFARTSAGFLTVPQLGRVVIEDDVEIGANSTVDRGSVQDTVVGAGTRIDNLVQIGHNVRIGRCCVIVAQVGISGSTVLEDFVQVGGQAAMAGHLNIGRGAQIGAQAGVIGDLADGAVVLGSPAQPRFAFLSVAPGSC